jgi:hypothetical protein
VQHNRMKKLNLYLDGYFKRFMSCELLSKLYLCKFIDNF